MTQDGTVTDDERRRLIEKIGTEICAAAVGRSNCSCIRNGVWECENEAPGRYASIAVRCIPEILTGRSEPAVAAAKAAAQDT